ncbi:TPK5 [Symbiodinium sp. CCMP2592]|nr:TPK5 [Symbiodinium sp. CCMP2592]
MVSGAADVMEVAVAGGTQLDPELPTDEWKIIDQAETLKCQVLSYLAQYNGSPDGRDAEEVLRLSSPRDILTCVLLDAMRPLTEHPVERA